MAHVVDRQDHPAIRRDIFRMNKLSMSEVFDQKAHQALNAFLVSLNISCIQGLYD